MASTPPRAAAGAKANRGGANSGPARPTVSLGMPVYNGERHVAQALESILAQTFEDFELVVGDNASEDATWEIVSDYARRDPRIRPFRHGRNLGAAGNHNFVAQAARGRFFKWSCHDDLLEPGFLARCTAALRDAPPDVVMSYARTLRVDGDGATIGPYDCPAPPRGTSPSRRLEAILQPGSILHHCYPVYGLMRVEALRRTRLIQRFNASDKVFLAELALLGDLAPVPERLFRKRVHNGNSITANTSAAEVARWFDPAQGGRFPMPRTKIFAGYLRAVRDAPLPPAERLRCLNVLRGALLRNREWRVIGGECRIALRERLVSPA